MASLTVGCIFPNQWTELRQSPTDIPTNLPIVDHPHRYSSQVILSCIKLTNKASHHSDHKRLRNKMVGIWLDLHQNSPNSLSHLHRHPPWEKKKAFSIGWRTLMVHRSLCETGKRTCLAHNGARFACWPGFLSLSLMSSFSSFCLE